jgi:hypothetical protein
VVRSVKIRLTTLMNLRWALLLSPLLDTVALLLQLGFLGTVAFFAEVLLLGRLASKSCLELHLSGTIALLLFVLARHCRLFRPARQTLSWS